MGFFVVISHILFYMFCVLSSLAIILTRKKVLFALLGCIPCVLYFVVVLWLFHVVPWVGLQCVIVVFHYLTHLLFFSTDIFEHFLCMCFARQVPSWISPLVGNLNGKKMHILGFVGIFEYIC